MIRAIASVLLLTATASALDWTDLYATWNTSTQDPEHLNSFYSIPFTIDEATTAAWTEIPSLNNLGLTTLCYPNDGQFCILFDECGHIAGFQIGILASDMDPRGDVYQVSKFDAYSNKTIYNEKYVTSTFYTINPETIATTSCCDWDGFLGTEGLWLERTANNYLEIPRNLTDLDPDWILEQCVSSQGTHYFYDMTPEKLCPDIPPWFTLYRNGELSGIGLLAFGSCTVKSRKWCEYFTSSDIASTIPTAPQCLIDWIADYGVISRHFFFTEDPWTFRC